MNSSSGDTMHKLTKTNFLKYLDCPEELWMQKNRPGHQVFRTPEMMHNFEQGNLVDQLARKLFKQGEITAQHESENSQFKVIADFTREIDSQTIDLYEAKATTSIKKEHIYDVAFQKMVFEMNGIRVNRCYLLFVNNKFEFLGKIHLQEFFRKEDISDEVAEVLEEVKTKAFVAHQYINGPEPSPRITIGCSNKTACPFFKMHYPDWPAYSIFDLIRVSNKKAQQLVDINVFDIRQIPEDFPLTSPQKRQVAVAKSNKPVIHYKEIAKVISSVEYPLYFLDYETFSYVIPSQQGYRPYQQMTFQYSLHVLARPGGQVKHYEYLLDSKNEPVENLLRHLQNRIDISKGTVVVWNQSFEKTRNKEMADLHPDFREFLEALNTRVYDLMDLFKNGHYMHPGFKGSSSIKSVLPVMVPSLSYEELEVQNGMEAVIAWHHLTKGKITPNKREQVVDQLLQYCRLDTLAMLKIWQKLVEMVSQPGKA